MKDVDADFMTVVRQIFLLIEIWVVGCGMASAAELPLSADTTDNVLIDEETHIYDLIVKDGKLDKVKCSTATILTARRAQGFADIITLYNDNVAVDKASAPGTKPVYRAMESYGGIFYDASRVCALHIPIRPDKKVKATVELTYKSPEHFDVVMLASPYHRRKTSVVINIPSAIARQFKVIPYNLPAGADLRCDSLKDGSVRHTLLVEDFPAFKSDEEASHPGTEAPRLLIKGYFADVDELYDYLHSFVDDTDPDDKSVAELARELKARAPESELALIDTIQKWVHQNIRYLAIEHGDYAIRPALPSEVIKRRSADCKGAAALIKALLRHNGIDGRLVWIGTKDRVAFTWDSVPILSSGNHMIAAAMLPPNTVVYLDGTSAGAPPGYVPQSLRGQCAMIEDGDKPFLAIVDNDCSAVDRDTLTADFKVEGEDLCGQIVRKESGVMRSVVANIISDTDPQQARRTLGRFMKYPKTNSEIDALDIEFADHSIILKADIVECGALRNVGSKMLLDLKPIRNIFAKQADLNSRKLPYCQPVPHEAVYIYNVALPKGCEPESLPTPFEVDDPFFKAYVRYEYADGVITCRSMLVPMADMVDVDHLSARNATLKSIQRASDKMIVINKVNQ